MGKHKILNILCLAVLLFHISGSQSRSLNDDESEHISKKSENIEDWISDCPCFPKSLKGTPASKFMPSDDKQERLVVYLYKNKQSGELTSYIPSWKKQSIFPDLTFDIGDKLQTIAADGIINLFDIAKPVANVDSVNSIFTVKPDAHLEIPSVPTSDNQHKNESEASPQGLNSITVETTPSEELTISSNRDSKITTGVTITPNLNLSLGNKNTRKQPLNGTITKPNQNIKPLEIQNLQMPLIADGLFTHLLPGKLGREGETIINNEPNQMLKPPVIPNQQMLPIPDSFIDNHIPGKTGTAEETIIVNSPEHHSQIPNKIKNQELNPLLGQQISEEITSSIVSSDSDNKITTGVTIKPNLNLYLGNKEKPLKGTTVKLNQNLKPSENQNQQTPVIADDLFAYLLPGKVGETIIINSPKHYSQIPNKINNQKLISPLGEQNRLIADKSPNNVVRYLPSKYKNPTFNDWFNKQMLSIRSQRPFMSDAINFHVLKPLLINALYENGIRPSENGDLHDTNGNTFKMSNLKLRPILLSDPMEYEKLIATKKCVIPYNLLYLEAVLVTLIYPPKILAIIPLDSKNVFISKIPGKVTPKLCDQSKCHSDQSSRSGFPVKEENTLDIYDNMPKDDLDSYIAEKTLEDRESIHLNNIESKNTYTYMDANNDPPVRLSLEPKYDDQNSLHLTLPSDPRISGGEIMYVNEFIPKTSKKKCHHKHCQINARFRSGSEKEEETSLRRAFNVNKANEENDDNALLTEESDGTLEKYEPIYMDYMDSNVDLPVEASLESKSDSQNSLLQTRIPIIDPEIYGGKPNILWAQPTFDREVLYLDEEGNIAGRKALEDFDDSQETPKKLDEEDYENILHIKIVGGNPATSSGTPVSSRGR